MLHPRIIALYAWLALAPIKYVNVSAEEFEKLQEQIEEKKLYLKGVREMQEVSEELFNKMQQQIEEIQKTYNKLPLQIRKELKENYPNSCPNNSIDELRRDINYWVRNIDMLIEDLEETSKDE